MEYLLQSHFTWWDFFMVAIALLASYFILQFTKQVLENTQFTGEARIPLLSGVERLLVFYEPIVILLLLSAFVLVNPVFHGIITVLIVVGSFTHIKNYISGRIIQMDKNISVSNRVRIDKQTGIISEMGRLGLKLKTDKGVQYINYSKLIADGFMLLSGDEIGGYYRLKITPKDPKEKVNYSLQLMDMFATIPYLDWNYKPTLTETNEENLALNAKIMVRENGHLQDLVKLIEERGFTCSVK